VKAARTAVTATFFVHGALFGTWLSRIPAVKTELALSDGELGLALLGVTVGAVLSLPLAGWLVSRTGSRATVVLGLPVFALLLVPLAFAPGLLSLAVALFAFGAAAGAVDVAMNAHGLAVEARYGRPILSSLHAGWSFGGLAGAAVGAAVAWAGVGPEGHFVAAAALLAAVGVVAGRALLPAAADRPEAPARLRRPPRQLAALAVFAFCGLFGEGAIADWSAVYVDGSLEGGAAVAALGFASLSVTMAAFRLVGDRLTTRWGAVTLARRGGATAATGVALALLGDRPLVALVGFAIAGAGLAALVPIAFRAAGSLPGMPPGAGIAALTTVGYTAFLVSPPTIGFAAEAVGLRTALVLVVLLLAAVVVLAPAARTAPIAGPDLQPHLR